MIKLMKKRIAIIKSYYNPNKNNIINHISGFLRSEEIIYLKKGIL